MNQRYRGIMNFNVFVLEDDKFFNNLVIQTLNSKKDVLEDEYNCEILIHSFLMPEDLVRNLQLDIDLAFIDYYLQSSMTGETILKKLKISSPDCRVVMVTKSESNKVKNYLVGEGADSYIHKDYMALTKISRTFENTVSEKIGNRFPTN